MQTVHRYVVEVDDAEHRIWLTPGWDNVLPLHIENKGISQIEFWAPADPDVQRPHRFIVTGTGHAAPEGGRYLGTAPRNRAGLVWHLWEVTGVGVGGS